VIGASEHNLKNLSIELPRDTLTVFTGVSGSGKSSLAFDTIFKEGQRRFLESLSPYARQFLGQMEKPRVEHVEGLSPTVSIDQKTVNRNPRSTVGTITELYDLYRLLFARFGKPHWLMIDEAQDLLGGRDNPAQLPLLRDSRAPGACLATWQPSRLSEAILNRLDGVLLTRHRLAREVECLSQLLSARGLDVAGLADRLDDLGEGQGLAWGLTRSSGDDLTPFKFRLGPHTFPQMHRLHQYLEERAPPAKRFYFQDKTGQTPPAGNLGELIDRLRTLDLAVMDFHFQRGDFSRWIRDVLHDETLARWLDRVQTADLSGEALRFALLEAFEQRRRMLPLDHCRAELPLAAGTHLAAELVRHQLHSVTNAKYR